MRFFVLALTLSVGLGCGGSSREARSPEDGNEDGNEEEAAEPQSEEAEQPAEAEEGDGEEQQGESRPAKKRRPKRRRQVQAAPEPEPAPIARAPKPQPQPVAPPPEEAPAFSDGADQGGDLEAEARKRCRWKKVPPYRPEWANSISPPLSRKITSKPICPYGTPPAVLRVARQIAVQQTNLNKR